MLRSHETNIRVIAFLIALFGLFITWWIPVVFMVLLSLRWRAWEVLALGLLIDLYFLPTTAILHPLPLFVLFGIAILWLFEPLRSQFLV